jgi:DNA-3-methyladenine glycosylase II
VGDEVAVNSGRGGGGNGNSVALARRRLAQQAVAHLSTNSATLAAIISVVGAHRPTLSRDPFRTLIGSIVQQQISMSAAAAIQNRLRDACPGRTVTADAILALRKQRLRRIGLSNQKSEYVRDLAAHFVDGRLSARKLRQMSDEQVIEATTQVRGVGRWTAEMLLIFCLERPDVWPIDDLGIRKAVRKLLELPDLPDRATLEATGEPLRPFRSYASWYLWRSLEGPLMPGVAIR